MEETKKITHFKQVLKLGVQIKCLDDIDNVDLLDKTKKKMNNSVISQLKGSTVNLNINSLNNSLKKTKKGIFDEVNSNSGLFLLII